VIDVGMIWALVLTSALTGAPVENANPLGQFYKYKHCERMMENLNQNRDATQTYFECRYWKKREGIPTF